MEVAGALGRSHLSQSIFLHDGTIVYKEMLIVCRYRAPECLLTDGYYNYKMDIWGIGCVWFEILSLFPLFPGSDELDQIQKIHNILGTPPREVLAKMRRLELSYIARNSLQT